MTGLRAGFFSIKTFFFAVVFGVLFLSAFFIPLHHAAAVTSTVIDSTITSNNNSNNGTAFTNVFINSSTGYVFFRDSTNACVYEKTTNGGTTWGSAVVIGPNTNCIRVAVWYDQWTPGNTTGTFINIATIETKADDLWYDRLNTTNDAVSTIFDVSTSTITSGFSAGSTVDAMTEGVDGTLYAGVYSSGGSFIFDCKTNCTTFAQWVLIATSTLAPNADDWMVLNPLPSGNILNIRFALTSSTLYSKVWHAGSSTWDSTWTTIDSNCAPNTTYDGHFGTAVNHNTNFIYMASACNIATLNSGANPEIKTWTYAPASSTWVRDADVETSSTLGITGTKIGIDINTGDIYVLYSGRTTKGTAGTANVYYKISTSTSMQNWGARQGPINATSGNLYGARIDGMSPYRLYATWADITDGTLNGATVAVFSPNTFTQSDYEVYQNENSTAVGNNFDIENATSLVPLAGKPFRLRTLVEVGGTGIDVSAQAFRLQYATTSATCNTNFSDNLNYADVGLSTSSAISFYNNASATNDTALTANSQDPTDGTNVIVNQTYVAQNTFSDDVAKIFGGQDGKWDFSLVNNNASSGQMFCFRIVNSDDSVLNGGYTTIPAVQVDSPPTVSNVTLNGGNNITLIEGTMTTVVATGTVTDPNGSADIFSLSGVAYQTSLGPSCSADNNDCYIGTGGNCSIDSCAGNSCSVECDYQFWYYARPTDSGTPWAGDSWSTLIQASDTVFSSATATSSGVPLLSLLAFETTSTINYGSFNQGQSMSSLAVTSSIRATGNTSMNVAVYGVNMTSGGFSIPVGQQHFGTSSLTYASGSTLLVNPGSTIAINLQKPTSTAVIQSSTFYWGIAIPSGQMATIYTGGNSFVGVEHALPWP